LAGHTPPGRAEEVLAELNGMVNRLILGMLVSGFAVGTALLY
jgi:hypothetical protein